MLAAALRRAVSALIEEAFGLRVGDF